MNQVKELGLKIKKLRQKKGMTLKRLSEETAISQSYLSEVERGLNHITFEKLVRLRTALKADIRYFLPGVVYIEGKNDTQYFK